MRRYLTAGMLILLASTFAFTFGGSGGCSSTGDGEGTGGTGGTTGGTGGDTAALTLTVTGVGNGMVSSNIGDLACDKNGGACEANIERGSEVTLTATPDAGYFFNGWIGEGCRGTGTCTVTLSEDKRVSASFVMATYSSNAALNGTDAVQLDKPENIWTILSDGTLATPVTALTANHIQCVYPIWSPDGERVAYKSNRNLTLTSNAATPNATTNIWLSNADGSGGDFALTHLTTGLGYAQNPVWSPDGSRLAYASSRNPDLASVSTSTISNIFVVNADGSGGDLAVTKMTGTANSASSPAWSPDSSKIAYASARSLTASDLTTANLGSNIWVSNSDGSGDDIALTQSTTAVYSFQPQWSPDGSRVVFVSYMDPADPTGPALTTTNIWIVNSDGSGLTPLTVNTVAGTYSSQPFWSPDGSLIVFSSRMNLSGLPSDPPNNSTNIWVIQPDGGGLRHLNALTQVYSQAPFWAPDGSLILFDSRGILDGSDASGSPQNLWKVTTDGSLPQPVTHYATPGIFELNPVDFD